MRRRLFISGLVLAGAVAAFWFFRDGEERGPELSEAAFVGRADAACVEMAEANRALEPPIRPYTLESESFFKTMHDNLDVARRRFDELNPPQAHEANLDRLVELYKLVGAKLNTVQAAASVDQDPEVKATLAEIYAQAAEIVATERELGICSGKTSFRESFAKRLKVSRADPNAGQGGEFDF